MKARTQSEHRKINRNSYPGTRQICVECGDPTERCEEDGIWDESADRWVCIECFERLENYRTGYDAGIVDSQRKCINELEKILEALAENTTDSNRRMAESGLSLIEDFKNE